MIPDSEYYPALLRNYRPVRYGYMFCEACDVICVGYPNEVKVGCDIGRKAEWKWATSPDMAEEDTDAIPTYYNNKLVPPGTDIMDMMWQDLKRSVRYWEQERRKERGTDV